MLQWTERQALIAAVAFALQRLRLMLRHIATEKQQPLDNVADPAEMAANGPLSTSSCRGTRFATFRTNQSDTNHPEPYRRGSTGRD